jgi:hypothetical protein
MLRPLCSYRVYIKGGGRAAGCPRQTHLCFTRSTHRNEFSGRVQRSAVGYLQHAYADHRFPLKQFQHGCTDERTRCCIEWPH